MVLLNQRTYYTTSDTTTVHADIETAIVTTRSVAASQTLRRHPDGNVASTSPASTVVIANSSPEGHVDVKEDRNSAELSHV
ncbi:hypothetical protein AN958_01651 [Leucoagaricus sp. SymC.cos]|nr:hypothetical protein AN958_01651 [Leucoagaricus sp. SymC.cos]